MKIKKYNEYDSIKECSFNEYYEMSHKYDIDLFDKRDMSLLDMIKSSKVIFNKVDDFKWKFTIKKVRRTLERRIYFHYHFNIKKLEDSYYLVDVDIEKSSFFRKDGFENDSNQSKYWVLDQYEDLELFMKKIKNFLSNSSTNF
jgi:hypothetical protein